MKKTIDKQLEDEAYYVANQRGWLYKSTVEWKAAAYIRKLERQIKKFEAKEKQNGCV